MKHLIFLALFLFGFAVCVSAQGIVFKIPEGTLPVDAKDMGLKGYLMLEKDAPAGLFIVAETEGETVETLRTKIAKAVAPMIADEDTKNLSPIPFEISSTSANANDLPGDGKYYLYKGKSNSMQITFYQRESNGHKFTYGYFARRKNSDTKEKYWMSSDGEQPKSLKRLIGSFKS